MVKSWNCTASDRAVTGQCVATRTKYIRPRLGANINKVKCSLVTRGLGNIISLRLRLHIVYLGQILELHSQ